MNTGKRYSRRGIAVIAIVALLPATLLAGNMAGNIDICLGNNIETSQTFEELKADFNLGKVSVGYEARFRIFLFEMGFKTNLCFHPETSSFSGRGKIDAGLSLQLGPFRLGAGIQTDEIAYRHDNGTWTAPHFCDNPSMSMMKGFLSSKANWRAKADILLGHFLVGVDYVLPTSYVIDAPNQDASLLIPGSLGSGKVSISLLYSFF
ncbi:MAG: hypothetical protein ACTTJZ_01685 [Sphaerochaetaceae bacterium]